MIEDLKPVTDVRITIVDTPEPQKVLQQPAGKELEWEYSESTLNITVPEVAIYDIVEIV